MRQHCKDCGKSEIWNQLKNSCRNPFHVGCTCENACPYMGMMHEVDCALYVNYKQDD